MKNGIVILDFGSQYNQLLVKKIRKMGVAAHLVPFNSSKETILGFEPKGIIFSGGPASVYLDNAFMPDLAVFEMGIPILGICYGMQLLAKHYKGKVARADKHEYGQETISIEANSALFQGLGNSSRVLMSHADSVLELPKGFEQIAYTEDAIAAIENKDTKHYGVQFHPEVELTENGLDILKNFIFSICQAAKSWQMADFIEDKIKAIREQVGTERVILGLSGGLDSSVAAVLLQKAIGNQLTCIFVDTGLMRKNEGKLVQETYGKHFDMNIQYINASDIFYKELKGVTDPERKRKIIGKLFIEVFDKAAKTMEGVSFLAQGTIYPDVIESQGIGHAQAIKSHHNVGGLPEKMGFKLVEPLRELFKTEVREIGAKLGMHADLLNRHPFPGPGLGIRILGEVTPDKVEILQEADAIFIEELRKNNLYDKVSQAFVALLPIKSVGVMGDVRTYENTAVVRSVDTNDFMTAKWTRLSYDFLDNVSARIINEVKGINRVVYDISSKPPATIEWE